MLPPQLTLAEPSPKHLLVPAGGSNVFHRTGLPGFDLDEEVFFLFFFSPYLHKGKIPLMVEKIDLTQISDTPKKETGSVLPLWRVLVFFFNFF